VAVGKPREREITSKTRTLYPTVFYTSGRMYSIVLAVIKVVSEGVTVGFGIWGLFPEPLLRVHFASSQMGS
jgi:hypothetical protein